MTAENIKMSGSPSVLVNMRVEPSGFHPFIAEMQLYVDSFLSLNKSQQKTYEITRAKTIYDLLNPRYKIDWERKAGNNRV